MASPFDNTRNFSLYTIPAAWVIGFIPHAYAANISKAVFDLCSPRTLPAALEKTQVIDKATKDRILRSEAAHHNGFENLGLFAAAVLAGNLAGLPAQTLNTLSGGYLLSRIAYNFVYINNTSEGMANVRTAVFLAGVGQIFALFIKSGNILKDRVANLI